MSNRNDLDRELAVYLDARSTNRAPDGLREAALAGVERTRQRPAWSVAGWWMRDATISLAPTMRLVVVVGLMLVLVSVGLAFVIGSSRHRLPPPFGLARPGLVAFDLGGQIFVAEADGSGRRPLTTGTDTATNPVWSPDGTLIAYESRGVDLTWSVVVMGADGGHPTTLAEGITMMGGISWSPDSRRVVFGARITDPVIGGEDPYDWSLYVGEADRPGATRLGTADVFGLAPSWSPDGKEIAFKRVYRSSGTPGEVALWVIGADGRDARRLSSEKELYNSAGGDDAFRNTAWSPDGKRLAYLADGVFPPTHNDAGLAAAYDVFIVNADGTAEVNVTNSPDEEYWPSWSPDGARIAFARMSGVRPRMGFASREGSTPESHLGTLFVTNPDGTDLPLSLGGPQVDSASPVWSPDGTRLLAFVFDPSLLNERAIAMFDPSGLLPTQTIAAEHFNGASWQRLAP